MGSVVRGLVGGAVGLMVALAAPGQARAQVRRGLDMQARFGVATQRLRALPTVGFEESRDRTSPGLGVTMLGTSGGGDLIIGGRLLVPVLTIEAMFAVGRYPTVYGASGGSAFELRPWGASQINVLLGGIGWRWKHRRWAWALAAQPGVSGTSVPGLRPGDEETQPMKGLHFMARATAEGCRRLDPETRLCAFVGANAYLDGWLNGVLMGVTMEVGP